MEGAIARRHRRLDRRCGI